MHKAQSIVAIDNTIVAAVFFTLRTGQRRKGFGKWK